MSELKPGNVIILPYFLGSCPVILVDEYQPGIWQVRAMDVEFLISNHVLGSRLSIRGEDVVHILEKEKTHE